MNRKQCAVYSPWDCKTLFIFIEKSREGGRERGGIDAFQVLNKGCDTSIIVTRNEIIFFQIKLRRRDGSEFACHHCGFIPLRILQSFIKFLFLFLGINQSLWNCFFFLPGSYKFWGYESCVCKIGLDWIFCNFKVECFIREALAAALNEGGRS